MNQTKQIGATKHDIRGNGYAVSRDLTPRLVPVAGCKPLGRATRKHPPQQVRKLAASLDRFGFVLPILIDPEGRVVAGWGLVLAARQLGLSEVPAVSLTDLSEAELRVLRLALNRIADNFAWDREALALKFSEILELAPQIDLEVSGFEMGEIDILLDGRGADQQDELPPIDAGTTPVSRAGDLWVLGKVCLTRPDWCSSTKRGKTVFMDNLPVHKVAGVEEAIEAVGASLIYLPAYSPDLNPIELAFSKLKAHMRKAAERTIARLSRRIGRIVNDFSPKECSNFFRHAGYVRT